jgi:hypothetical protein
MNASERLLGERSRKSLRFSVAGCEDERASGGRVRHGICCLHASLPFEPVGRVVE